MEVDARQHNSVWRMFPCMYQQTFRVTEKQRRHVEWHKIDNSNGANAEKLHRSRSISSAITTKNCYFSICSRRLGILRRILLFHVTNQLFSREKWDSKQTAESDWERKMLEMLKCFRDDIWNRKFTLFIVLLGGISVQARTIDWHSSILLPTVSSFISLRHTGLPETPHRRVQEKNEKWDRYGLDC